MSETPKLQNVTNELIEAQVEQSTLPLQQALNRNEAFGDLSTEEASVLGHRIVEITESVNANPERVVADTKKFPWDRTEYDVGRAQIEATAINDEMTYLAKDNARSSASGKDHNLQKRQRAELSRIKWADTAGRMYDDAPIEVTTDQVRTIKGFVAKKDILGRPNFKN